MLRLHYEKEKRYTVATVPVTAEDATGFGITKTDDEGNIESFVEKPHASELEKWASVTSEEMHQAGKIYLASMGIYIINKKTLLRLFTENQEAPDTRKKIIPLAAEDDDLVTK